MKRSTSNATAGVDGTVVDERTFQRLLRRATATVLIALGVPLLLLLGLVIALQGSALRVDRAGQITTAANRTAKFLITMQTGFRGYRLANDERYLGPFQEARAAIDSELERLELLASDDTAQREAVNKLRTDLRVWLRFIDDQFDGIRAGQKPVNDSSFMVEGAPLFERANRDVETFIAREERLRLVRMKTLDRMVVTTVATFAVAVLVGLPFFSFWLVALLRKTSGTYTASLAHAERRANELHVTLQSIGDAVVATNAQGKVDFLNPVAEALMGWTSAEARGRPIEEVFEIFDEQTGVRAENPVARALRENIVVGIANHTVLRARDGRKWPIEDSSAPIRGEDGGVLGVILVFHDVTAKRDDERRLAASESRLRFLNDLGNATRTLHQPVEVMEVTARMLGGHLRASRCAYAEVAEDGENFTILHDYCAGCVSTVGDYQLSLFGPRAEDLREGRTLIIHDVDKELSSAGGAAMFRAIGVQAIVCFALVKGGRLRALMAVHQTARRGWTDEEVGLVGIVVERCWETIERARAEQSAHIATEEAAASARGVADTTERFRLLSEVVALQVWTAGVDGGLVYANQECAKYFGVNVQQEIYGDRWTQFVHPADLPAAAQSWQHSLATAERYEVEFRLRGKDGGYRWFLVRATAMRDPAGRVAQWFGTNTEIDELKRAQAGAEQASRAKDDFIAALSHELRTPLTPVLLTTTSLREDDRLPADVKEQLVMIERNIALEARLIDDLLDITSIVHGKLNFRAQLSDVHALIGFALEIVREDAQTKKITIAQDFGARSSGLMADPARFQQVIWNLLRNAVKFTPRGGDISVRTRDHLGSDGSNWLLIDVADSGIGLASSELERIFQPFDQGGLTGDHRFGGVGLGLSIARAVVQLHGGRISAKSAGADQGSTFTVELPGALTPPHGLVETPEASAVTLLADVPAPTPSDVRTESLRLLLVEDHESTLVTMTRLLTRSGHAVTPVSSVGDALAAAAVGSFDLVISDLGLPDGTGTELMEKLRDRHGLRGIALSGYGMEEDIARSRAAGFVAHLIKPVDFAHLRRVLKTLG